jgi:hypothetical protein
MQQQQTEESLLDTILRSENNHKTTNIELVENYTPF